ncbi:hypothetical protein [Lactobacillus helveticus]|uniref:hypothetical protein n=1 Tax=Lactobacillus helveticus TaxID=1587 RepID=UPI00191BC6D7|nr:hypothetical protein [Lactobacillus helveticus]GFP00271.1 hypothetical protein LHEW6_01040 [Lactobacillus helveticus]GFP03345.1 hypothetical protein LHEY10_12740 [Lactobacillus helveticus]
MTVSLNEIAFEIKQFLGDGNIHGSIVDIAYYDHIYLDPMTAKLKIYNALSTMNRTTYSSVRTLLEDRRGKFLPMLAEYTSCYDMLSAYNKNTKCIIFCGKLNN